MNRILGIDPAMLAQFEKHAKMIEGITASLPANLVEIVEQINAMPLGRIAETVQAITEAQRKP